MKFLLFASAVICVANGATLYGLYGTKGAPQSGYAYGQGYSATPKGSGAPLQSPAAVKGGSSSNGDGYKGGLKGLIKPVAVKPMPSKGISKQPPIMIEQTQQKIEPQDEQTLQQQPEQPQQQEEQIPQQQEEQIEQQPLQQQEDQTQQQTHQQEEQTQQQTQQQEEQTQQQEEQTQQQTQQQEEQIQQQQEESQQREVHQPKPIPQEPLQPAKSWKKRPQKTGYKPALIAIQQTQTKDDEDEQSQQQPQQQQIEQLPTKMTWELKKTPQIVYKYKPIVPLVWEQPQPLNFPQMPIMKHTYAHHQNVGQIFNTQPGYR